MSYDVALLHHGQRMLMADCGLDWDAVQLDEDDEICFLDTHERMVTVRFFTDAGTTWLRVFVNAAQDLKRSAKLLREVNELNVSLIACRALLLGSRLMLSAEVTLESLEPDELRRLVDLLSENAERSGPMIQMLYGQESPDRQGKQVEP